MTDELTDAELHVRIIRMDAEALRTWHDRYRTRLTLSAQRMGLSPEDAEEVWDDAFLATLKRLAHQPIEPLGGGLRRYLFGVVRRRAADRLRRLGRDPILTSLSDLRAGSVASPTARHVGDEEEVVRLRECIERAPERHRLVASAVLSSASAEEIGELLGIGKRSVYVIVKRTLTWLGDCVSKGERHGS